MRVTIPDVDEAAVLPAALEAERQKRLQAEAEVRALRRQLTREREERIKLEQHVAYLEEKTQRKLSLWDPRDYVRLLWWIVAQPERFRAYKERLEAIGDPDVLRQGSWLASTLLWWPMFFWAGWPWFRGELDLDGGSILAILAGISFVWILTGVLGSQDDALSAFVAVLMTAVMALITVALVTGMATGVPVPGSALWPGILTMFATMTAVAVAAVSALTVADTVAGVMAVLVVSGVVLVGVSQAGSILNVAAAVAAAVLIAGVVEERFKQAR